MTVKSPRSVALCLLLLLLAASCGGQAPADPSQIAQALELENGGFEMSDEAPMFGDPTFDLDFDVTEIAETETSSASGRVNRVAIDGTLVWAPVGDDQIEQAAHAGSDVRRLIGRLDYIDGDRGLIVAAVFDGDQRTGDVRGRFGVRENGDQVFFAKYIDHATGAFLGLFAGRYDANGLSGSWRNASGVAGSVQAGFGAR